MSKVAEAYKARQKAEQEGVWAEILCGEVKIKAACGRNKEFMRLTKGIQNGQRINDDKLFEQLVKTCAKSVVSDWDGFEVDYTEEAFIETCNDLKDCGFIEDILALAMDKDLFNQVALAQSEKN